MTSGGRACPERSEGAVDKAAVGPAAVIDRLRTQFYCRSPLLHLDPLTQRFGCREQESPRLQIKRD
jgi:hypothetical protein